MYPVGKKRLEKLEVERGRKVDLRVEREEGCNMNMQIEVEMDLYTEVQRVVILAVDSSNYNP
jgi:hypothetical protein